MTEDLGTLIKRLIIKGERVVIVGEGQPMVIMTLEEYERLSASSPAAGQEKLPYLEPVDPLSGGLGDDDQYFPEPI